MGFPLWRSGERSSRINPVWILIPAWLGSAILAQQAIIIDHECTQLNSIPEAWIVAAKSQFRLSYGHTSHGSQVVSGMDVISEPAGSLYWWDWDGTQGGLSLHDYTPGGDLGNPDRVTWAQRTRDMLNAAGNDRNVVMWSWCGQADTTADNIQIYLDLMTALEIDYPNVIFIYMTGHLNGTGVEGNLNQRNEQIRAHCIANGCVLFDFADIESYDPDGNEFLSLYAEDDCDYHVDGHPYNWADQWCAAHPGQCSSCSCAHSRSLNCDMKGRAFWWMMARLAGWNGATSNCLCDTNGDQQVDEQDLQAFCAGCWQPAPQVTDFDGDGVVSVMDGVMLIGDWGTCP